MYNCRIVQLGGLFVTSTTMSLRQQRMEKLFGRCFKRISFYNKHLELVFCTWARNVLLLFNIVLFMGVLTTVVFYRE